MEDVGCGEVWEFLYEVVAKEAELTGWPRSRNPVVSSTGRGGADLSVGCRRVENSAIVAEIEVVRVGLTM